MLGNDACTTCLLTNIVCFVGHMVQKGGGQLNEQILAGGRQANIKVTRASKLLREELNYGAYTQSQPEGALTFWQGVEVLKLFGLRIRASLWGLLQLLLDWL